VRCANNPPIRWRVSGIFRYIHLKYTPHKYTHIYVHTYIYRNHACAARAVPRHLGVHRAYSYIDSNRVGRVSGSAKRAGFCLVCAEPVLTAIKKACAARAVPRHFGVYRAYSYLYIYTSYVNLMYINIHVYTHIHTEIMRALREQSPGTSVYVGDSVTDLLALLEADVGIVVGTSATLMKVALVCCSVCCSVCYSASCSVWCIV